METRAESAVEKYKKGFNCAQAIACTYADKVDLPKEELFRVTEGFGHGMGSMAGTCGAIAGACVLAGLRNSTCHMEKPDSKAATAKLSREILNGFQEKWGTVTCRDLKGVGTGNPICSCHDCIRTAAGLAEKILFPEEE